MGVMRFIGVVALVGIGFAMVKGNSGGGSAQASAPKVYPDSSASYAQVDGEVGCSSKFSDQKKDDIFEAKYKNHWMTWKGRVELADADNASLNTDGKGIQDLRVDFEKSGAGYDLTKGSIITVRFLMSSAGGCFLPFGGKNAVIIN